MNIDFPSCDLTFQYQFSPNTLPICKQSQDYFGKIILDLDFSYCVLRSACRKFSVKISIEWKNRYFSRSFFVYNIFPVLTPYTVKTNFISTCEISEKARYGKISFISHVLISFSDNSHENFPAKNMKT